jgi:hypothetical protein
MANFFVNRRQKIDSSEAAATQPLVAEFGQNLTDRVAVFSPFSLKKWTELITENIDDKQ